MSLEVLARQHRYGIWTIILHILLHSGGNVVSRLLFFIPQPKSKRKTIQYMHIVENSVDVLAFLSDTDNIIYSIIPPNNLNSVRGPWGNAFVECYIGSPKYF